MIPAKFDYAAPGSIDEAVQLLQTHGDEAKLLAGGHSLLPLMKLRLAAPELLIDLGRIPDLAYIRDAGNHVAIGAMTTHGVLEESELVSRKLPLLSKAASVVGDMQVRSRGTIGGSLAHADPAADLPAVVLALEGEMVARGPEGERTIAAEDFFAGIWTTALQADEVLSEIRIPYGDGQDASSYQKFRQRASDWAIVGVAVTLGRRNQHVERASVVLTNVGATPVRAIGVEGALAGEQISREGIQAAASRAAEGLDPSPDLKASTEYKRHLASVLTERALQEALGLA